MSVSHVRSVPFKAVDKQLRALSSELADVLGPLCGKPGSKGGLSLHVATYPYGTLLIEEGKLRPPCQGKNLCPDCQALLGDCSYCDIPLAIVLSKSVEVHLKGTPNRQETKPTEPATVPLRMIHEGELFGVFESLDRLAGDKWERPFWNVSSGARSAWILAPTSDQRLGKRLAKALGRRPKWNGDQCDWRLIQELMLVSPPIPWETEVLFLGGTVLEMLRKPAGGAGRLFETVLQTAWQQSAALRRATAIEASFRQGYLEGPARNLKSAIGEMYLFAMACQIFSISRGDAPAFEPAGSASVEYGPFTKAEERFYPLLGEIFDDPYYPVLLQPVHLKPGRHGLFSFSKPTLPGLSVRKPKSYVDLTGTVMRAVSALAESGHHALDLESTSYFGKQTPSSVEQGLSPLKWEEFLGASQGKFRDL